MLRPSAPILAAALLGQAGCFYTTGINDRPQADIDVASPAASHVPRGSVALSAHRSSDSESVDLDCAWTARFLCDGDAECPPDERAQKSCFEEFIFALPAGDAPGGHVPVEVHLEVTDEDGARSTDVETIVPGNRAPTITVQAPPLGSALNHVLGFPIEVSAEIVDEDGDPVVAVDWELVKPRGAGTGVVLEPVDEAGTTYRFTPDVADVWHVVVTAADGFEDGENSTDKVIQVDDDRPPCIGATSPAAGEPGRFVIERADGPRTFSVLTVVDDLDPYPLPVDAVEYLGESEFAWQIASPDTGGALVPVTGATAAELTLDPASYAPGDLIDLRVEVADRRARVLPCDPSEPTCSATGDSCAQRLSWGAEIR